MNEDTTIQVEGIESDETQNITSPTQEVSTKPNASAAVTLGAKKRQLEKLKSSQSKNHVKLIELQAAVKDTDEKIIALKKEITVDEAIEFAKQLESTDYSLAEVLKLVVSDEHDALEKFRETFSQEKTKSRVLG